MWEGSRNPYLVETLERYFVLSLRVWYVVLDRVPGLGAAVFDHARLLEAMLDARPGPGARADARARDRLRARDRGRVQPGLGTNVNPGWVGRWWSPGRGESAFRSPRRVLRASVYVEHLYGAFRSPAATNLPAGNEMHPLPSLPQCGG